MFIIKMKEEEKREERIGSLGFVFFFGRVVRIGIFSLVFVFIFNLNFKY